MKQKSDIILYVVATSVFLAGLVWTAASINRYLVAQRHLDRKLNDLKNIAQLEHAMANDVAAVTPFEEFAAEQLLDPGVLLRNMAPELRAEVRQREIIEAWGSWRAQRWEIRADSVSFETIGTYLTLLEAQQPKWHLLEGTWTASDEASGKGRVAIVIEGLEKP